MSEKKEASPEVAGLPWGTRPEAGDDYLVPDYVMRDFGDAEE